tara:strand:+ start:4654 stop:4797 length:144 start_codon:yes stop_codon:yes gene_type:complete
MKNKKLLVVCPFPQGVAAGEKLKFEQNFDHWRENGYSDSLAISNNTQ